MEKYPDVTDRIAVIAPFQDICTTAGTSNLDYFVSLSVRRGNRSFVLLIWIALRNQMDPRSVLR
jgi:hypothetical protein